MAGNSRRGRLLVWAGAGALLAALGAGACTTGDLEIPKEGGGVAPADLRYGNQTYES